MGLVLVGLVGVSGVARADGAPVGADVAVAQTLGPRELTVTIRRTDGAPAPLHVDIVSHVGDPVGILRVRTVPPGSRPTSEATAALTTGATGVDLTVDRFGAWELELDDGTNTARIPFTVPQRVVPAWERVVYGGFVATGAFLLVALVFAARGGRFVLVPAGGVVVSLSVAVTAALLSSTIPPPTTQNVARPPVSLVVSANGLTTGHPTNLVLSLTDSATGLPVDDLLVNHGALVHLMVMTPTGDLVHLHPVRVAPGDYRVQFTPTASGTYPMAAELARVGGGTQLVRAEVQITGTTVDSKRKSDGTVEAVEADALTAGNPVTLTADFTGPDNLQPWLGMRGHLIIVGPLPSQAVWAHVHAMTTPTVNSLGSQPDETVAAYPAKVPFTFTFPEPGRYHAWFQSERGFEILTIPVTFDVGAAHDTTR